MIFFKTKKKNSFYVKKYQICNSFTQNVILNQNIKKYTDGSI